MPQKVNIALVQMSCRKDPRVNLEKAGSAVRKAASKGAKIVCLQELFHTLYFCQSEDHTYFSLAEAIPGPTSVFFSSIAKEKKIVLIVPIFEKRAAGLYHNSAAVIDADGRLLGIYRKMHIPEDPNFYEKFYFTPGDAGFPVFETRYAKVGVLICWDQWFPEAARLTALAGAEILFYPTAIGWHKRETKKAADTQRVGWEIIQRGHAVANEMFVAVPNRVGREEDLTFWGSSFISNPFGNLLAKAGEKEDEILMASCDLSEIEKTRQHWPFLRDRRIDAYSPITQRFLDQPKSIKTSRRVG